MLPIATSMSAADQQAQRQKVHELHRRMWRSVVVFSVLATVAFLVLVTALVVHTAYGFENLDVACACVMFTSLAASANSYFDYRAAIACYATT